MEVPLLTGCYLRGMKLPHLWSHDAQWMGEGRGVVNMVAAGNTTSSFLLEELDLTLRGRGAELYVVLKVNL